MTGINSLWTGWAGTARLFTRALFPTLTVVSFHLLAGGDFEWLAVLQIWLYIAALLLIAAAGQPGLDDGRGLYLHPAAIGLILFTLGSATFYGFTKSTLVAWTLFGSIFCLLLGWATASGAGLPLWSKAWLETGFAAIAGLLPVLLNQIETRFSTEEFFVILEVLALTIFWLALRGAHAWGSAKKRPGASPARLRIRRGGLLAGLGFATMVGMIFTVQQYQASFYPKEAPPYAGISPETPFLCADSPPSQQTYAGDAVFESLLARVAANPYKGAPEYAFLALGTGDPEWAQSLHESLLAEAKMARFTERAGSVKYGQYLASQRAYYYLRVREAFPGLFSAEEEQTLTAWFAAINRRAQTVEWVDWMYALAFAYWPQGPYENQETGAGLLALLETSELADPNLSAKNRAYLAANPRGWSSSFRVTDDAAMYQPEWIQSAWFQAGYTGVVDVSNQRLSFEWLKALALPDGSPLRYNHVGYAEYASLASWGAVLLEDETLLWLAGRALESAAENPWPIPAQPGAEQASAQTGISPTLGACLLYGDSGLPTQSGPLAPDKVVFRSGWEPDAVYLLLNLRFSGWHRYKASNTVIQIYQSEPLVIENSAGEAFNWLPAGRSLFRDKRIPRENLNGLQVYKSGLDRVLYRLTGIGGPWAQDPPFYAEVVRFESMPDHDLSVTFLRDWHGWQHQRKVLFYPDGVVIIADEAHGPEGHPAELTWHLVGETHPEGNRIGLGRDNIGAKPRPEAVLLPIEGDPPQFEVLDQAGAAPIVRAVYPSSTSGKLQNITVVLFDQWVGAAVQLNDQVLIIEQSAYQKVLPMAEIFGEMGS